VGCVVTTLLRPDRLASIRHCDSLRDAEHVNSETSKTLQSRK
jgi:hypothetical protein